MEGVPYEHVECYKTAYWEPVVGDELPGVS